MGRGLKERQILVVIKEAGKAARLVIDELKEVD